MKWKWKAKLQNGNAKKEMQNKLIKSGAQNKNKTSLILRNEKFINKFKN